MSARTAAIAWEALFRAQVSAMRRFEAERDFAPLRPREYDVLFNLAGMGGAARQHELNERLLISQPSLSRMVDRLTTAGHVQRRVCEQDGRGVVVALTEAGAQLQRTIGRRHVRHIASILDAALTEDEQRTLAGLTDRLRAAVTATDHHRDPVSVSSAGRGKVSSGGAERGSGAGTGRGKVSSGGASSGRGAVTVSERRTDPGSDGQTGRRADRQTDRRTNHVTEGTS